jgi:hypothetical protein
MLLARHHPAVFDALVEGKITLDEAVREAGLSRQRREVRLRYGVLDVNGVRELRPGAQSKLLCEVFQAVGAEAHCRLLSEVVGPAIGIGLANRWREHATRSIHPDQRSSGKQGHISLMLGQVRE